MLTEQSATAALRCSPSALRLGLSSAVLCGVLGSPSSRAEEPLTAIAPAAGNARPAPSAAGLAPGASTAAPVPSSVPPPSAPGSAVPKRAPAPAPAAASAGAPTPAAADQKPPAPRPKARVTRDDGTPRPGLADSIWLKDGTRVRGTVLRVETDNYVILLGAEGVRTIPWRNVARIEAAISVPAQNLPATATHDSSEANGLGARASACCVDELAPEQPDGPRAADWAQPSLGWDLRAEGVSLFKHYTVAGRGAWYAGEGVGGGGSVSAHFRGPAWLGSGVGVHWTELELGVSDSLQYVDWREGAQYRTNFLQNQLSAIVGLHLASGHFGSDGAHSPWSGAVFGVAWLPTYVRFFGSQDFESSGKFHPAGLRFSADWGRVSTSAKGLLPGLRASITWLPYIGTLPTMVAVGLGAVFY